MDFKEAYPDTISTVGMAARLGNLHVMKQLIKNGKPADVRDNRGWTPLHEAASGGHYQCLYYLLRTGVVDPDWKTFEEETALLLAARSAHQDCVRVLLKYCASPNICTHEQFSPLYEAAKIGSLACVKLLLECSRLEEYISERSKVDEEDGKEGAVNHMTFSGVTPLHAACKCGANDVVELLLKYEAKINKVADFGLTPVFYASQFGHDRCLKTLLETARDRDQMFVVDAPAHDNATPLLIAAQNGYTECVRILLECGADPDISLFNPGLKPLHFALEFEHESAFKLLLSVTENKFPNDMSHPLVKSIQKPSKFLTYLIENGYNIHQAFEKGSPHNYSWYSGDVSLLCLQPTKEAAMVLLNAGLPVNPVDKSNLPPLASALRNGDTDLCRLYLEAGANLNINHDHFCGNFTLFCATTPDKNKTNPKLLPGVQCILKRKDLEIQSCFNCVLSGKHRSHQLDDQADQLIGKYDLLHDRPLSPGSSVAVLLCLCTNLPALDEDYLSQYNWWKQQKNFLQKIQVTSNTLMHMCRVKIVREMMHYHTYITSGVDSLYLPELLKDYLMFSDTLGSSFIQTFDACGRNN